MKKVSGEDGKGEMIQVLKRLSRLIRLCNIYCQGDSII